jgi:hypothetical protein
MKGNRHFGGTYSLHLQGRRISQEKKEEKKKQYEAGSKQILLHTGYLLCLFFDLEDGGDMLL